MPEAPLNHEAMRWASCTGAEATVSLGEINGDETAFTATHAHARENEDGSWTWWLVGHNAGGWEPTQSEASVAAEDSLLRKQPDDLIQPVH